MVLPTPICVRCCYNCDAKATTCADTAAFYQILNTNHSVFSRHFSWGTLHYSGNNFPSASSIFIEPRHFFCRVLYNKLKSSLREPIDKINQANYPESSIEANGKNYEQNLQQMAQAQTTINRFLSAFIDHVSLETHLILSTPTVVNIMIFWFQGLKDLDYVIQEKTILENWLNFEFDSIVTESMTTPGKIHSEYQPFMNIYFIYSSRNILPGRWPFIRLCTILWQRSAALSIWNHAVSDNDHLHTSSFILHVYCCIHL